MRVIKQTKKKRKRKSMNTIIPEDWDVPIKIRERFGDTAGKQRAMQAEGHLIVVVHEPPGPDDIHRKAVLLWRQPHGAWRSSADGAVTNLLKNHVARYTAKIEKLEDDLQSASCASDYFELLQAVAPLQRASRNLHGALQQARELVAEDHEIIVARDAAADAERGFELLHEDAKNGLEYTMAQKAELQSDQSLKMAESAHRLNILAALFFPITAITSIFGMNFHSGFESTQQTWPFYAVLGIGFAAGVVLARAIADQRGECKVVTQKPAQGALRKSQNRVRATGRTAGRTAA
jgi:Mg2+ and Co2+ transporter CorA